VVVLVWGASMWGAIGSGVTHAAADTTEECVAKRVAEGETRAVALAACLRQGPATTVATTRAPAGDTSPSSASSGDDGGTSAVLLIVTAVIGVALGAGGATLLRRRSPAIAAVGSVPSGAGAPLHPPTPSGPPPPAADRSPALIGALIDLSDRMSSQALRAEIIATLARAGVHPIEIAPGTPFEATTMRGIGSSPTSDPAWVGRVATTDRCGFHDAGRVVRLPDVVVYTGS
jgi:hypothetical protein